MIPITRTLAVLAVGADLARSEPNATTAESTAISFDDADGVIQIIDTVILRN